MSTRSLIFPNQCTHCGTPITDRDPGGNPACADEECILKCLAGDISPQRVEQAMQEGKCPSCEKIFRGNTDPDTCGHSACVNRGVPAK